MLKPDVPTRLASDDINSFGARVLQFLLANDYSLGLFDTSALEAAHYAAHKALAQRIDLGNKERPDTSPAIVFDRIEDVRRQITSSLTRRAAETAAALEAMSEPELESIFPKGSNRRGDQPILVSDITPKPKLPPSLAYAEIPAVADPF